MVKFNIGDRVLFTLPAHNGSEEKVTYRATVARIGAHEDGAAPETEYGVVVDDWENTLDKKTVNLIYYAGLLGKDLTVLDAMEAELVVLDPELEYTNE